MDCERADTALFEPIVPEARWHPSFRLLRQEGGKEPARVTMEAIFSQMGDRDGNFREQFQTSGFDSRVWELYLYAALDDSGFDIDLPKPGPDFLLSRSSLRWALEATTANLRQGEGNPTVEDEADLLEFLQQELPIRLGSPLFSKLQVDYASHEDLAGLPFVLGLECFVSPHSAMFVSESPLGSYLYGVESIPEHDADGVLSVRHRPIHQHRVGDKVIPSGFFNQPGAETISAILFSNNGTVGKFTRMGYQSGVARERLWMGRFGLRADNDPNATVPRFFAEEVGTRTERWRDGLVIFHNPNANRPLPDEAFDDIAVQYAFVDGQIRHTLLPFHVFGSQTVTLLPPAGKGVEIARRKGAEQLREIETQFEQDQPPDTGSLG